MFRLLFGFYDDGYNTKNSEFCLQKVFMSSP